MGPNEQVQCYVSKKERKKKERKKEKKRKTEKKEKKETIKIAYPFHITPKIVAIQCSSRPKTNCKIQKFDLKSLDHVVAGKHQSNFSMARTMP